jgi:hypothetical protein
VAAEVEPVAVRVDDGLGDAADLLVGLEDDDLLAGLGQQVSGGQAGRAATDDEIGLLVPRAVARIRVGGQRREFRGRCHGYSLAHDRPKSLLR